MNPTEKTLVRLSKSILGKAEAEAVERILCQSGYVGMGEEVDLFERELAEYLGVPRDWVVSTNTGTSALHLAAEAVSGPGDAVLVQSLTYVASFQAIRAAGAEPISCEVHPRTFAIDLNDAEKRFVKNVKAVMPVHYAGSPGDLDGIYAFAKKKGIRVIEDAAHAFGSCYKGRRIGSFGDIVCFSFDGIKNITSGEGGAIVTSDPDVLARVKDARLLGVEKDSGKRFASKRSWDFDVRIQGYRYHMSNVMASIGRVQLKKFELEMAPKRITLAKYYHKKLQGRDDVILLDCDLDATVLHIQVVRIPGGKRNTVREALEAEKIQTGLHYKPNHLLSLFGGGQERLPVTEKLYDEILTLPLHPDLECSNIDRICEIMDKQLVGKCQ